MQNSRGGLLTSPGLEGQSMKGVYFFPDESGMNAGLYTTHPLVPPLGRLREFFAKQD